MSYGTIQQRIKKLWWQYEIYHVKNSLLELLSWLYRDLKFLIDASKFARTLRIKIINDVDTDKKVIKWWIIDQ